MKVPTPAAPWRAGATGPSVRRRVLRSGLFAALAAVLVPAPANARLPRTRTLGVRGVVEGLDGDVLVVRTSDGPPLRVRLLPQGVVHRVEAYPRADIVPGDVVDAFAMTGAEGRLRAASLYVHPQGAKRRREADVHVGWGRRRDTTRTLSPVTGVERAAGGHVLNLTLRWRRQVLEVPLDASVAVTRPANRSAVVPGAIVSALAFVEPDESLVTVRIIVGDAALPPAEVVAENRWRDP